MTAAAVVAAKVAASLPQLPGQAAAVAITWLVTGAFVGVGVVLLHTDVPPVNGWACLLVALATVPGDLNDAAYPGLVTAVGFVLEPTYLAAASALVLVYPTSRLTRPSRSLVTGLLVVGLVSRLGAAVTTGRLRDGFYRAADWPAVQAPAALHDLVFVRIGRGLTAALLLAVAAVLGARLARTRGLARQALAPMAVIGLVCSLAAAVDQLVWVVATPAAMALPGALVRNLSAALIPVALIADLLRRRAAGAAVSDRILRAAASGHGPDLQQAVRDVFVDPTATVEYADGRGGWLDVTHQPVPAKAGPPGRRAAPVVLDSGETALRLVYDPRAVTDEQLVALAVDAVTVGADASRLRTELLAALTEVGQSRTRIVEASLAERRRVERDLHDGAQQQLLAIASTLAATDLVDDDHVREVVGEARTALSGAIRELRALAHGIHPAALSQGGLAAALPGLVERVPFPVVLRVDPDVAEAAPTVQGAAYFVVAELLTNVVRHADAAHATVTVAVVDGTLTVGVSDDGRGGARFVPGGGLSGLRDRVNALGGTLVLEEPEPHRADSHPGTTVRAVLPAEEPQEPEDRP